MSMPTSTVLANTHVAPDFFRSQHQPPHPPPIATSNPQSMVPQLNCVEALKLGGYSKETPSFTIYPYHGGSLLPHPKPYTRTPKTVRDGDVPGAPDHKGIKSYQAPGSSSVYMGVSQKHGSHFGGPQNTQCFGVSIEVTLLMETTICDYIIRIYGVLIILG